MLCQQAAGGRPALALPTAMRQTPGGVAETVTGHRADRVASVAAADAPVRRHRHHLLCRVHSPPHPLTFHRHGGIRSRTAGRRVPTRWFCVDYCGFFVAVVRRCRFLTVAGCVRWRRCDASNVDVLDVVLEYVLSVNGVVALTAAVTTCAPVSTLPHQRQPPAAALP